MRVLALVLALCALALCRGTAISENDALGKRIIARAEAAEADDSNFVFAEIVDDVHAASPAPIDMAAVELDSTISAATDSQLLSQQQQQQQMFSNAFFPGYPAAAPGFYGGYSYAPNYGVPNYLANMRYAAVPGSSGSSSASPLANPPPFANAAYSQYGIPYSAFPPIPPPMPTYLPPPPYIPLATPTGGAAGSGSSA